MLFFIFYFDPEMCGMFFWHYDHVLLLTAQSCRLRLVSVDGHMRSFYASGQICPRLFAPSFCFYMFNDTKKLNALT